jgi:hypothetical protein
MGRALEVDASYSRCRRAKMELAKAPSESPPNQILVFLRRSRQRTGSESIMARQDLETRDARARVEKGRKLRTWETSSGGRSVRKSRARVGVRTECRVRRTGRGEWRRRVRRKWDWSGAGRLVKWERRDGSVRRVVNDRSGWSGA